MSTPESPDPMSDPEYEADLLARVNSGDENASDELFGRLRPEILRYAWSRTDNFHDAEDIAQTTLEQVLLSMHRYEQTGKGFDKWARVIAYRAIMDHFRASKKTAHLVSNDIDIPAPDDIEQQVTSRAAVAEIKRRILERHGRISNNEFGLLCHLVDGGTLEDYAEEHGLTPENARVRLHRTRHKALDDLIQSGLISDQETIGRKYTPVSADDS